MTADTWDIVVIGAGPAGAMAALESARRGASVLLTDKHRFPRHKPCGCCINGAALALLADTGLGGLTERCGGRRLGAFHVAWGRRHASIPLPVGVVLSRSAFDAALVEAAVGAGAVFQDGVVGRVGPVTGSHRIVTLGSGQVRARAVVVATGLGTKIGDGAVRHETIGRSAGHIGLATIIDGAGRDHDTDGVHMACGPMGYVGWVRLEDDRLNVAAAIQPGFVRLCGGPGRAVASIMASCGGPVVDGLIGAEWRGTPLLTRTRPVVASERLFVVGDAAGYVEPFTGEGIGWALAGGRAVAAWAAQPWNPRLADEWAKRVVVLRRRQAVCRAVAAGLRWPWAAKSIIATCSAAATLAGPVVRHINRPLPMDRGAEPKVA